MHMAERFDGSVPPEPLPVLRGAMDDNRYVCLLSLDGGTGSVKLMAKVVLEGEPAQAMSSVFLVAEAHGVSESHDDLRRFLLVIAKRSPILSAMGSRPL